MWWGRRGGGANIRKLCWTNYLYFTREISKSVIVNRCTESGLFGQLEQALAVSLHNDHAVSTLPRPSHYVTSVHLCWKRGSILYTKTPPTCCQFIHLLAQIKWTSWLLTIEKSRVSSSEISQVQALVRRLTNVASKCYFFKGKELVLSRKLSQNDSPACLLLRISYNFWIWWSYIRMHADRSTGEKYTRKRMYEKDSARTTTLRRVYEIIVAMEKQYVLHICGCAGVSVRAWSFIQHAKRMRRSMSFVACFHHILQPVSQTCDLRKKSYLT